MAGAILSPLRCCFAWQAQYSLNADAVSRGSRTTVYYLAKAGRRGPPWSSGLLAWQAQYFLHSDAVSHGRRSTLNYLEVVYIDADLPKPAERHSFSRFLFPRHTPTHVFSHALILSSSYLHANSLHTLSLSMRCLIF